MIRSQTPTGGAEYDWSINHPDNSDCRSLAWLDLVRLSQERLVERVLLLQSWESVNPIHSRILQGRIYSDTTPQHPNTFHWCRFLQYNQSPNCIFYAVPTFSWPAPHLSPPGMPLALVIREMVGIFLRSLNLMTRISGSLFSPLLSILIVTNKTASNIRRK